MTTSDENQLHEISRELPAIDLDATTAERIARRARHDLGKGPPRRRLILPIIAALVALGYAAWGILKLIELLT
jgi:hypothetical protein